MLMWCHKNSLWDVLGRYLGSKQYWPHTRTYKNLKKMFFFERFLHYDIMFDWMSLNSWTRYTHKNMLSVNNSKIKTKKSTFSVTTHEKIMRKSASQAPLISLFLACDWSWSQNNEIGVSPRVVFTNADIILIFKNTFLCYIWHFNWIYIFWGCISFMGFMTLCQS